MAPARYKRVLLKLSGEALMGDQGFGISARVLSYLADEVRSLYDLGIQLALVIGGGNIFRGVESSSLGMDRTLADHMGMLATVINSIALSDALEKKGIQTRIQSAIAMDEVAEPYILKRALRHLDKGRVVIFAAGTGNPYFTTDTAAVLRAQEIHAEILLKATKVDGLYDADPKTVKEARPIWKTSYRNVIEKDLRVMDMTAITLAMDNNIPIVVFNMNGAGNVKKIICGESIGTYIGKE